MNIMQCISVNNVSIKLYILYIKTYCGIFELLKKEKKISAWFILLAQFDHIFNVITWSLFPIYT